MRKVPTTIYLTEQQRECLKKLSERTHVPVAEYIRQGIDLSIDKYKDFLPGQMTFDETLPLGNNVADEKRRKPYS